jgi:hypothetical protein
MSPHGQPRGAYFCLAFNQDGVAVDANIYSEPPEGLAGTNGIVGYELLHAIGGETYDAALYAMIAHLGELPDVHPHRIIAVNHHIITSAMSRRPRIRQVTGTARVDSVDNAQATIAALRDSIVTRLRSAHEPGTCTIGYHDTNDDRTLIEFRHNGEVRDLIVLTRTEFNHVEIIHVTVPSRHLFAAGPGGLGRKS